MIFGLFLRALLGFVLAFVLWIGVGLIGVPVFAFAFLVGTIVHEATHALVATLVGELHGAGWQGGLAGGPYVDFRAPTRWRSEAVRKAPLALGVGGAIALVAGYPGPTLGWVAAFGVVAGLLWTSPEDLFIERATESGA